LEQYPEEAVAALQGETVSLLLQLRPRSPSRYFTCFTFSHLSAAGGGARRLGVSEKRAVVVDLIERPRGLND